jgi:hypothetical protein
MSSIGGDTQERNVLIVDERPMLGAKRSISGPAILVAMMESLAIHLGARFIRSLRLLYGKRT